MRQRGKGQKIELPRGFVYPYVVFVFWCKREEKKLFKALFFDKQNSTYVNKNTIYVISESVALKWCQIGTEVISYAKREWKAAP